MAVHPAVKLTRKQIYDEVWCAAVSGMALKYSIPYSFLLKQIKGANIPIPPSVRILRALLSICKSTDKTKNPNAFPIGNKFGFFMYGGRYRTRTYDLPHVKRML